MRRLFLAFSLILLSPKRAMRQSVLRTDAQPLGTGRQPLDAVGRGLFPCTACFWLYLRFFFLPSDALASIVLRTDTQPLGTGRQPLDAVGRGLFPCTACFWLYLRFFFLPSDALASNYVRFAHIIARAAWDAV